MKVGETIRINRYVGDGTEVAEYLNVESRLIVNAFNE
jgi:hypothetical protein